MASVRNLFSLLIKPAGPDCNLRCSYCFYLPKLELFDPQPVHRMDPEILEQLVRGYLATPQPEYLFNWQGGEPTLMGLDFFQTVIDLQNRHASRDARVTNTIQTNATLIDVDWARFIAEHRILVGVSLDGPEEIHDTYRRDVDGSGTFGRVMDAIEHLRSSGAEFNLLTMVTSRSEGEAAEIFDFFKKNRFRYQQYIPCVEFDDEGEPKPYTVSPGNWGRFMIELFDAWYPKHIRRISIRNFDAIVNFLAAGIYSSCSMRGRCDQYLVVEHNGNVYPCDFFVEPEWQIGNIMEDDWANLVRSPVYRRFGALKSRWNSACDECPYLHLCSGDCPKLRYRRNRDPSSLSYLCKGHRSFFGQTIYHWNDLAQNVQNSLNAGLEGPEPLNGIPPVMLDPEALCFCGSGKKLKNCHGKPGAFIPSRKA